MKKIINAPERFIPEMLEGIYAAHPDELMCVGGDLHCLVSKRKHAGKVGIATGGGSGHLPLFLGYVGEGMLDGCSIGDVFQSPSAEQMLAVTKEIDQGAGVLYIYGNYNGDIFNFDMAAEMADMEEDIRVESVVAGEDVASAGPSAEGEPNKRRGVAGIFFVYKCAGAAAAAYVLHGEKQKDEIPSVAGDYVSYVLPQRVNRLADKPQKLYFRVNAALKNVTVKVTCGGDEKAYKKIGVAPGEMESVLVRPEALKDAASVKISVEVNG